MTELHTTHLTEDERQTAADGTLPAERRAYVDAHSRVRRVRGGRRAHRRFMKRTRERHVVQPPRDGTR
jgi:hypothetical protein